MIHPEVSRLGQRQGEQGLIFSLSPTEKTGVDQQQGCTDDVGETAGDSGEGER
jgi:hypothetical protein